MLTRLRRSLKSRLSRRILLKKRFKNLSSNKNSSMKRLLKKFKALRKRHPNTISKPRLNTRLTMIQTKKTPMIF